MESVAWLPWRPAGAGTAVSVGFVEMAYDTTCAGGGAQYDDTSTSVGVQYDADGAGAGVGAGVGVGACAGAVAADCTVEHCL